MMILKPGRIGTMEVKNRVVMAAMGAHGLHEPDGSWGERYRAYYKAKAAGGVGLITTEATFVSQALEPFSKDLFNPASDKHLDTMRLLADALHSHGCKLSIQLTAGFGRVVPPPVVPEGVKPVSASENKHYSPVMPDGILPMCREITTDEAAALARSFGFAAKRCREVGADCVELHGHEGYLLDQFMTGLWNRRTDRYGGSKEKRLTFAREAIAAIQQEAGADFPIIYRYGITHYLEGGREEEEGLWIAVELEKMGVAALHVDAGCYETHWWPHPPMYAPPATMVDLAEKVKKISTLPIIAVGRLQYPEAAEKTLTDGKADFVALGRGLLSDPEWVNKVASGRTDEICPCLGCHEGCKWQMIVGQPTSCSLNPTCGHEIEWALTPLKQKRSLLVVGGGPAGMEAARVGAERGFDVTLWEATDRLGGNLWPAGKPDFKHDILDYIEYLTKRTHRLQISVELHKRATAEDVQSFGADYVVLATGAVMVAPPFEDKTERVLTAIQVLSGMEPQGQKVLVMGGGIMGTETALYLTRMGKQVTISTRRDADDLAMELFDHNNHAMLMNMVQDAKIDVLPNTVPLRLNHDGVVAEQDGSEKKIQADSIVFAGPLQSLNDLSKALENSSGTVFSIGDCVKPDRIMDAVWSGFKTVREIE